MSDAAVAPGAAPPSPWTSLRQEHPNPRRARSLWLSLDGEWQFAFDDDGQGRALGWPDGIALPHVIRVPFPFEAPLSGLGLGDEVHRCVWYHREFEVPAAWGDGPLLLHFGAVDWRAEVWVNGHSLRVHEGGYSGFTVDVPPHVLGKGPQHLVVAVDDPAESDEEGWQPRGKQRGSGGIWYTRVTGIWQPVWLEPVHRAHIRELEVLPDLPSRTLRVRVECSVGDAHVRVVASLSGTTVAEGQGRAQVELRFPDVECWSPASPVLYDVVVTAVEDGLVRDRVITYAGFRDVGTTAGAVTLNGEPVFLRGVLDQGYWPDGLYTPPSPAALLDDVLAVKALGFNAVRKHMKVEVPHWYYWCDRAGLLVIQDMPSSADLSTAAARATFAAELEQLVRDCREHPCVVTWVVFNEDWGSPGPALQGQMVALVRGLDPTRLVIDASGWHQGDDTDLRDVHDYGADLGARVPGAPPSPPLLIGEFGGISCPVAGHVWGAEAAAWGYQDVSSSGELLARYAVLVGQVQQPRVLAGFVYTQLTDVETETNGLLTYDRCPKVPFDVIAPITGGEAAATVGQEP